MRSFGYFVSLCGEDRGYCENGTELDNLLESLEKLGVRLDLLTVRLYFDDCYKSDVSNTSSADARVKASHSAR